MCNVRMLAIALLLVSCDGSGCAALAQQGPTLSSVMSRVDVPRLLRCAELDGAKRVARCLGAEALTQGLAAAIEEATRLAESAQLAGNGGAGAADYSDADRLALAAELDEALNRLADEIAATHAKQ